MLPRCLIKYRCVIERGGVGTSVSAHIFNWVTRNFDNCGGPNVTEQAYVVQTEQVTAAVFSSAMAPAVKNS